MGLEEGGKICYNIGMGNPTPPGPTPGSSCDICDELLWPTGFTPGNVHVEFKDLKKCPLATLDPPNAIWVLTQDDANPCYWQYDDNNFKVIVEVTVGQIEVGCTGVFADAGDIYFRGQLGGCFSHFNNINTVCVGNIKARFGTATITWS
ncbi:unnamed protein product [marine sediment metagenome]|uniref:Uncharacterized protein n=1 Tax=marine sediment metagenome TaxID=412755 RepID=X1JK35_9ZZZZ